MKGAIDWARKQAEAGEPLDAARTLELLESHEALREAHRDALSRAAGHAYATAMAEGGEEIQHQELEAERKQHAGTLAQLRKYEEALTEIRLMAIDHDDNPIRVTAEAALSEGAGDE
jgi:hypothetical protein